MRLERRVVKRLFRRGGAAWRGAVKFAENQELRPGQKWPDVRKAAGAELPVLSEDDREFGEYPAADRHAAPCTEFEAFFPRRALTKHETSGCLRVITPITAMFKKIHASETPDKL